MPITRIFLDLDDVLNDFTLGALRYVGCRIRRGRSNYRPEWGWDIVTAANQLHTDRMFTEAEFWQSIDRAFWANAPKSQECDWLLDVCESLVGRENVCILSAPTLDPDCLAGKLEWIQRFMPKWMHRQFLIGPRKHFCARPDALLIDDRDKNVRDFTASGGLAVTMPRPWNIFHAHRPREYVASVLSYAFSREVAA